MGSLAQRDGEGNWFTKSGKAKGITGAGGEIILRQPSNFLLYLPISYSVRLIGASKEGLNFRG